MNYKKEELKLLNMKKVVVETFRNDRQKEYEIFDVEKELSIESKTAFIDSQRDGVATYLVELFNRWENEKDSLPQHMGRPKTISKKAWIRKNDTRGIIDNEFNIGRYSMFGTSYNDMSLKCPPANNRFNLAWTGHYIVEQWFHDLLEKLYREEKKHFEENDPYTIKLKKVKEFGDNYPVFFNSRELNDIIWNGKEEVEEKRLDAYINAYENLKKAISDIELDLKDILGEDEEN